MKHLSILLLVLLSAAWFPICTSADQSVLYEIRRDVTDQATGRIRNRTPILEYTHKNGVREIYVTGEDFKLLPGPILKRTMEQSVEEIISDIPYVAISDNDFQQHWDDADTDAIFLFYNNHGQSSAAMAVVAKMINYRFPAFKLYAYKIPDGARQSSAGHEAVHSKYSLPAIPCMKLAHFDGGKLQIIDALTLSEAPSDLESVILISAGYFEDIPQYFSF